MSTLARQLQDIGYEIVSIDTRTGNIVIAHSSDEVDWASSIDSVIPEPSMVGTHGNEVLMIGEIGSIDTFNIHKSLIKHTINPLLKEEVMNYWDAINYWQFTGELQWRLNQQKVVSRFVPKNQHSVRPKSQMRSVNRNR